MLLIQVPQGVIAWDPNPTHTLTCPWPASFGHCPSLAASRTLAEPEAGASSPCRQHPWLLPTDLTTAWPSASLWPVFVFEFQTPKNPRVNLTLLQDRKVDKKKHQKTFPSSPLDNTLVMY